MNKWAWVVVCVCFLGIACSEQVPRMSPESFDEMVLRHVDSAQAYNKAIATALSNKDSSALWDYTERFAVLAGELSDSIKYFPYIDPTGYVSSAEKFAGYLFFLAEELLPHYDELFLTEPNLDQVREIIWKNDSLRTGWNLVTDTMEQRRIQFLGTKNWELRKEE